MRRLGGKYQWFLGATAVSSLGDGLLVTGLPLLAREASKAPLAVAAVWAAGRLPYVFGIAIGTFVDRREARSTMVRADLLRAIVLGSVGIYLLASDNPIPIWVLILLSVTLATGAITFFAATHRVLPAIVGHTKLDEANGMLSTVTNLGEQFIGPPLGALFVVGGKVPILGDALSFAGSAAVLWRLDPIPAAVTEANLIQDITVGWRWFKSSQPLRFLVGLISAMTFVTGAVLSTEVILIKDTLGMNDWWFGVFTAVMAAGAILGGFIAARCIKLFGLSVLPLCILVNGVTYLACVGSRAPMVVFSAIFVQQGATVISVISTVGIRQRMIPPDLRGRVMSLTRSIAYSVQIPGALLGGWVAGRYGTDPIFGVAGTALLIVGLVTARPYQIKLGTVPVPVPVMPLPAESL